MPERHLLDILKMPSIWTRYTRHFGPPSGTDPKLASAVQRYIFTVFGYGCNLGPSQTARHAPASPTPRRCAGSMRSTSNANKLEAATTDVINQYARFRFAQALGRRPSGDR